MSIKDVNGILFPSTAITSTGTTAGTAIDLTAGQGNTANPPATNYQHVAQVNFLSGSATTNALTVTVEIQHSDDNSNWYSLSHPISPVAGGFTVSGGGTLSPQSMIIPFMTQSRYVRIKFSSTQSSGGFTYTAEAFLTNCVNAKIG